MTDTPLISVIIPVFNNWSLTQKCLTSLHTHAQNISFEVIVVDNNSTDGTATDANDFGLSLFGDRFVLLRQNENLGFAKATNLGARTAKGRYLYLLNNDTIIITDPFSAVIRKLQNQPELGAVGPLLLYPDSNRVQHLGIAIAHGIKSIHLYHLFPASNPVVTQDRNFQAITMAAFCVEKKLYDSVDGLFEGYVNGMEDIDFCARLGQQGLSFSIAPESVVEHIAGQSLGRFAQDAKNSRLLASRCSRLLNPDMNLLAEADGYQMRLTPWLDPYLVLPPEHEQDLTGRWQAQSDLDTLVEMLNAEPCWEYGWDMLIKYHRDNSDLPSELSSLVQKSAFFPTPQTFARLKEVAVKCGDESRLLMLTDQDSKLEKVLGRPSILCAQAKSAMSRAKVAGNESLCRIISSWITENFPNNDNSI